MGVYQRVCCIHDTIAVRREALPIIHLDAPERQYRTTRHTARRRHVSLDDDKARCGQRGRARRSARDDDVGFRDGAPRHVLERHRDVGAVGFVVDHQRVPPRVDGLARDQAVDLAERRRST